jgi:3-deoxy-D-manno-octulosonic-acid transferase
LGIFRHSLAALTAVTGAPAALGVMALRPTWRIGWRERIGALPRERTGAIWIHAASVGEILAATRLVDRLRSDGHAVVTSTMTVTGRDVMRRTRPEVACHLAPLDHPWCVDAALARTRPAALVFVETELWPTWIAGADRAGVPLVLVSGRISASSFGRYRRLAPLFRRVVQRFQAIGARTAEDRERFIALGADAARVSVSGDLKLELDTDPAPLAPDLAAALGKAPLFVAGSTHPGEETAALRALRAVEDAGLQAALVLAPRRPERSDDVVREALASGRVVRRRTALGAEPLRAGEVLVLDTLGELAAVFSVADAAFVGGSLAPVGGHNVLEPVLGGRPVIYGPSTRNVRHATEILEGAGAARRLEDAGDLGSAVIEVLGDPEGARARGDAGRQALARHRGAAARAAALVTAALEGSPPSGHGGPGSGA